MARAMSTVIKAWITSAKGEETHVLCDNGQSCLLRVPPRDEARLFGAWARDVQLGGHSMCVHECLSDHFAFFVQMAPHEPVAHDELARRVRAIVRGFIEEGDCVLDECIVVVATGDTGGEQPRVRLVWPDFVVDSHMALTMRERIVAEFDLADDARGAEHAHTARWHGIVDYNCYRDGVSLPGSREYAACEACGNKRRARASCTSCMFRGVRELAHVYVPRALLYGAEYTRSRPLGDAAGDVGAEELHRCAVRRGDSSLVPWRCVEGTPRYASEQPDPRGKPRLYPHGQEAYGSHRPKPAEEVPAAKRMFLKRAIVCAYPAHYAKLTIGARSVVFDKKRERYTVFPRGIGCHYCCKRAGEHTDERVYFHVTARGVQQMCSSAERLADGTECKRKVSDAVAITGDLRRQLFHAALTTSTSVMTAAYNAARRISDHHWEKKHGVYKRKCNLWGH